MALYSIFDWDKGLYRVYTHPEGSGLYDPGAKVVHTRPHLGVPVEDVLVSLPAGSKFVGTSHAPMGRIAVDGIARRQVATAKLPEGIGSLGALGVALSPPDTSEFIPSAVHPLAKWGPVILLGIIGFVWWDLEKQKKRNRRRR